MYKADRINTAAGETVELTAADGHRLAAYIAGDPGCGRALVLCHDTSGLCGHMRRMADRAAAFGFHVIAPAFFDRVERGIDLHTQPGDLDRGAAVAARVSLDMQMQDVAAAIAYLSCGRTGLLGFGWGATAAWRAAARLPGLHALVGFYGPGIAEARQETPLCPAQLHFGEGDHLIPLSDVNAIATAQPHVDIAIYPIVDHLFACDESESFHMDATETAQDSMLAFLQRYM